MSWYAGTWLLMGAAVVAAVALLGGRPAGGPREVSLPPVREIELATASHKAGCMIDRISGRAPRDAVSIRALTPRVYPTPVNRIALARTVRRGIVVIEYRPSVGEERINRLTDVQQAIPRGTVLAPGTAREADDITVTAYRRRLTCPVANDRAFDALLLFRGRFLGSGPDA